MHINPPFLLETMITQEKSKHNRRKFQKKPKSLVFWYILLLTQTIISIIIK